MRILKKIIASLLALIISTFFLAFYYYLGIRLERYFHVSDFLICFIIGIVNIVFCMVIFGNTQKRRVYEEEINNLSLESILKEISSQKVEPYAFISKIKFDLLKDTKNTYVHIILNYFVFFGISFLNGLTYNVSYSKEIIYSEDFYLMTFIFTVIVVFLCVFFLHLSFWYYLLFDKKEIRSQSNKYLVSLKVLLPLHLSWFIAPSYVKVVKEYEIINSVTLYIKEKEKNETAFTK